jgi:preprotein translocase subunit YajC
LFLIAALALPMFLNVRRQKRAMAEAQELQKSLTNGDRVMTTSGLHATVVGTADEATVELEIAPGTRTTWLRAAVREKLGADTDEPAAGGMSEPDAPLAAPQDSARADNS